MISFNRKVILIGQIFCVRSKFFCLFEKRKIHSSFKVSNFFYSILDAWRRIRVLQNRAKFLRRKRELFSGLCTPPNSGQTFGNTDRSIRAVTANVPPRISFFSTVLCHGQRGDILAKRLFVGYWLLRRLFFRLSTSRAKTSWTSSRKNIFFIYASGAYAFCAKEATKLFFAHDW